jgi:transaldolase
MNPIQQLHRLGQAVWLDSVSRRLLDAGTLRRYVADYALTGLTSNPTIFEHAIGESDLYDASIRRKTREGVAGEGLAFELALEDLVRAADLFRPVHDASGGRDGWVSLEVSPLLASDSLKTLAQARELHRRAARPNLFVKIPGTRAGLMAIEAAVAAGVPVNVTLLFSAGQYAAAANAYWRGIERRLDAGLDPGIASVASLFVSRWDRAVHDRVPPDLRGRLGTAVARLAYRDCLELHSSDRWRRLAEAGARPQRLLWASTGTKDPAASDVLYVESLIAPGTINTMPEATLLAFADHGQLGDPLPADGGEAERVLKRCADAGIDLGALASELQRQGTESFTASWRRLLDRIAAKAGALDRSA